MSGLSIILSTLFLGKPPRGRLQYGCFFKTTLEKNVKIIIKKTIRECKDTEKKYPVAAKNILSRSSDICVILQRNFENKYEVTFNECENRFL